MSDMTNQMMLYDAANSIPIELLALQLSCDKHEYNQLFASIRTRLSDYRRPKGMYNVDDVYDLDELKDEDMIIACFAIPYKDMNEFSHNVMHKHGSQGFQSHEIMSLIKNSNEKFHLQQHSTTLLYDGRQPRRNVLAKLLEIAKVIEYDYGGFVSGQNLLRKIVYTILEKPDERTLKKYIKTLVDYARAYSGTDYLEQHYYYNFRGLLSLVQRELKQLD